MLTDGDGEPPERLAPYRAHGVTHGILRGPFDSLSRLQREAALRLAGEWGRERADEVPASAEIAHGAEPKVSLAGLWLVWVGDGPIQAADLAYWTEEAHRWRVGEGSDPRLAAFCAAWREAVEAAGTLAPPGPRCLCPDCRARYRRTAKRR